jgi:16S rRNA (guanine527-N7)-methyltransferase
MGEPSQQDIEHELTELHTGLNLLQIAHDQTTINAFTRYLKILYEFKDRLHLVSRQDYTRISQRHFITSLMAYHYVEKCSAICDIGAGAGFPSVPLKIVLPHVQLTLYESITKKARFLCQLVERLHLENVEVRNERAEHVHGPQYECILFKAVGAIASMLTTIDNLLYPHGIAIFYKTHRVEEEINRIVPQLDEYRLAVEVKKLHTPVEQLPVALVLLHKTRE